MSGPGDWLGSALAENGRAATPLADGVQLTPRDLRLLEIAARMKVLTTRQLAAAAAIVGYPPSGGALPRRLPRFRRTGLLESRRTYATREVVWWVTYQGCRACGSPLSGSACDMRSLEHDLTVTEAALGLLRDGEQIVTERELRGPLGPEFTGLATRLGHEGNGSGGTARRHYPDLAVIASDGQRLAVEVELTARRLARYREILEGYGSSDYALVTYLVSEPRIGGLVRRAAEEVGFRADRLRVSAVESAWRDMAEA